MCTIFELTVDEANIIAMSITGVWALAWTFRQIGDFLSVKGTQDE